MNMDVSTLPHAARQALELLQQGRLSEAESLCRRIIAFHPGYFHAAHLLGIIALQRGDHASAARWLAAAVAADPAQAPAHSNLAAALTGLRKPAEALACCDRALGLKPDFAEALSNRGDARRALERDEESLASYDRALALAPALFAAHLGRGAVLARIQSHAAALRSLDRALSIAPGHAHALNSRGNALLGLDRPEEALAAFDAALARAPALAEALNGRGCALRAMRRFPEALRSFDQAIGAQPNGWAAYSNRAKVLLELERYADAIESCEHALRLNPRSSDALILEANALQFLGRSEEAEHCFARAAELQPDVGYTLGNRLMSRAEGCDWRDRAELESAIARSIDEGRRECLPFVLLSVSDSAEAQLECARMRAQEQRPASVPSWRSESRGHRRIRVAYVSGDFGNHPVSYLLAGVLERHDRSRFEVFGYYLRTREETPMEERVRRGFEHRFDVSARSDLEVATMLRESGIDIAVDLAGFTRGARPRIFAYRAAPIQVNYLGFPGTVGADYMDYIVADEFVIPPGCAKFYSEQVAYLPECFQANDDRRVRPGAGSATRASESLSDEAFVFCSFNNSYKVNPGMFDIWMRLLARVPGSVLWMLGDSERVRHNLRGAARDRGIEPDRLVFARRATYDRHLARLPLADLFLDTLPFNAGATASDALWMGLPVLTCPGEAFAARMAGSLLSAAGTPELIARDLDEYEAKALQLARDPQARGAIRDRLCRGSTPLFDTERFRRHLESAYETMWMRHRRGERPQTFSVPLVEGP
jgi:protein O-GlcNAc transferase